MVTPLLAGAFGVDGASMSATSVARWAVLGVDSGSVMGKCGAAVPLEIVSSWVGNFAWFMMQAC